MSADKSTRKTDERNYQGVGELFRIRRDLSKLRKAFYISMVFLGLVLAWYGVWTAVGNIWLLKEPIVAIVAGVALLLATHKIKDLM